MTNMNCEKQLREMAEKWRHANVDVYDALRNGSEEIRLLKAELQAANRELEIYRRLVNKQHNLPSYNYTLGWGKDKDE